MRRLIGIAALLLMTLSLVVAILWLYCRVTLDGVERRWKAEVATERARVAAEDRPPLRGEARDANAAEEYEAIAERLEPELEIEVPTATGATPRRRRNTISEAVDAPPAPLSGDLAEFMAAHEGDIASLRRATHARRCDFRVEYERGPGAPTPNLIAFRVLAHMLVLDGRARELAGDHGEAARRYLDCVRFGADVGDPGALLMRVFGIGIEYTGGKELERAIECGALEGEDLAEADREVTILDGLVDHLPPNAQAERLLVAPTLVWEVRAGGDFPLGDAPSIARLPVVRTLFGAWAVSRYDRLTRELDAAEALPMFAERRAREREVFDGLTSTPLIEFVVPNLPEMLLGFDEERALRRLIHAAALLDRYRAKNGALPARLADAGDPPKDPFDDQPLRYALSPDGKSAKVWSIGSNLVDDGGRPGRGADGDIVLTLPDVAKARRR